MTVTEIKASELNTQKFISEEVERIGSTVGDGLAVNALSGGVDSCAVTLLGHRAIGERLKTYFIDNGLMRQGEPEQVIELFAGLGVKVERIDARAEFFQALEGVTDPEQKREAITQTFYKKVFAGLVRQSGAKYLLQGTILTDIDETVAGIKRQHNVFEQLGIDPQQAFGYKIIEPVVRLRKDGVRLVARALGLPESVYARPPFPGPALAARVIGAVTRDKIELVRKATAITEQVLASVRAFQNMTILHEDRVTGMRNNQREFGLQLEVRCWDSIDARVAKPTELPWETLRTLAQKLLDGVPGVVSVTYHIAPKPPSTMEVV